ncbi:hypothetical protein TCAL_01829 [Tigriopus californicus]|uniref:Uncharacterized protein n=1 Tax=Tigriopus californicus TaxID=6832 RepID=A0A553ND91_TIGCA|nr:hypothetical protein TCAL_01829 [Tigriopus californicus]|eukprot:TCALIF_01829-PA protein Name:"Protein of unknown function" AED:0.01 eAED:0.01 QI:77/0.83/0.57/1/0.66/0.42/7/18/1075
MVQMVAGIYFMMELPIFSLGSNIWTGAWNIFTGSVTLILCCHGYGITVMKAQGILLLSLAVLLVNLVNLLILEVGEWRGFLTDESKQYIKTKQLNDLMYHAYMTTTISTVTAMIVSFFASQQTFCYLQIQNDHDEDDFERKEHHFSSLDSDTVLTTKDLVNRQSDLTDTLNLKTPSGGPQPHPSWVYRNTYNTLHPSQNSVKRSLSFLNGGQKQKTPTGVYERRYDLLGTLSKSLQGNESLAGGPTRKHSSIHTIPELCREPPMPAPHLPAPNHRNSNSAGAGTMRHAIIRRHQSMYIHPRTTTEIQAAKDLTSHYKMHEVSGKSEVRPIVTLQRSKTTAGATSNSLHYRATSIQTLHSHTMRPSRTTFNASVNKYLGSRQTDFNHNTIGNYGRKPGSSSRSSKLFDLPDPEKYRRKYTRTTSNAGNGSSEYWSRKADSKPGSVMFDSENHLDLAMVESFDHDKDSCHGNIRYQAVDRQNINSQLRQNARSLENLLHEESTPENERQHLGLINNRSHYGSTESISSLGSTQKIVLEGSDKPSRMTQTPTSLYSHESSTMNTSNDSHEMPDDAVLYDVPKRNNTLQKSNSRVTSNGKLRLHVESFRSAKNTNGTQTDLTVMKNKENMLRQHQFKKHAAPPSKPIRKTKPFQGTKTLTDCNQSDRSASPDNSSTSGYSSPSAGPLSKETSPYGSKMDDKMMEEENDHDIGDHADDHHSEARSDRLLDENGSKVTVIQIVPASLSNDIPDHELSFDEGEGSPVDDDLDDDFFPTSAAIDEYRRMREQSVSPPPAPRRELPRISTNGTLGRGFHKRRLPDHNQALANGQAQRGGSDSPYDSASNLASLLNNLNLPTKRMYRSPHPRPSNLQFAQGRVPLPPVPELERSDHERESISPIPPSKIPYSEQELILKPLPKRMSPLRPLPSPLSTPIQPNDTTAARSGPIPRARQRLQSTPSGPQGRTHRQGVTRPNETLSEEETEGENGGRQEVDDNLVALLELLREKSREGQQRGNGDHPKENTLQYLSQLEHVARQLKDQLLMQPPGVHGNPIRKTDLPSRIPQYIGKSPERDINNESDC